VQKVIRNYELGIWNQKLEVGKSILNPT
jgi:hypothetical protein